MALATKATPTTPPPSTFNHEGFVVVISTNCKKVLGLSRNPFSPKNWPARQGHLCDQREGYHQCILFWSRSSQVSFGVPIPNFQLKSLYLKIRAGINCQCNSRLLSIKSNYLFVINWIKCRCLVPRTPVGYKILIIRERRNYTYLEMFPTHGTNTMIGTTYR